MKNTETTKVLALIEQLKTAKNNKQIEDIFLLKEDVIWSDVEDVVQDLWYEAYGDAKKGLYF